MSLIARATNVTLHPKAEWPVIAAEPASPGGLYAGYVAPLAALGPIALFIGLSIVGVGIPFVGMYRVPFFSGIAQAVISFALTLLGVFIMALIAGALAPVFDGQRNGLAALKLVAYSLTPAFIAGLLGIIPPLAALELFGALWALYVFAVGAPAVLGIPKDKAIVYTLACATCAIIVGFGASLSVGAVIGGIGVANAIGRGIAGVAGGRSSGSSASDEQTKAVLSTIVGSAMGGSDKDREQAQQMVNAVASAAAAAAPSPGQSGDPSAQAQAGMNALKALVGGGGPKVTPVSRDALRTLLPESAAGLPRTASDAQTSSVAGIAGSGANANYSDGKGSSLELEIADLGNVGGITAIAKVAMNNIETENDEGYEKNIDVDGRRVHVKWTNSGKQSEVIEIVDGRYAISANGSGLDLDAVIATLRSLDIAKLQALGSAVH